MLKSLLKLLSLTVILRVVAMAVTLVFVSLMSKWMTPSDYGLLAMLLSATTLTSTVGGLGQTQYLVRELAPLAPDADEDAISNIVGTSTLLVLAVSLGVGLLAGVFFGLSGRSWAAFFAAALLTVLLSVNTAWSGYARSKDLFVWAMAPRDIFWRLATMAPVALWFMSRGKPAFEVVALILTASLAIVIILQGAALNVRWSHVFKRPRLDRKLVVASRDLTLADVGAQLLNNVDVFLVGALMSPLLAGEYFPANRVALVALFFQAPFQIILSPSFARYFHAGDIAQARRLSALSTAAIFVASAIASLALMFAYPILDDQFATFSKESYQAMAILISGQLLATLSGFPNLVLIMSGHQNVVARQNLYFLIVAPAIIAVACMSKSIVFVAVVVTLLKLSKAALMAYSAWRKSGVPPFTFNLRRSPGGPA